MSEPTPTLFFDATDEFPDMDEFVRVREHYWVLGYKGEEAGPGWLMSPGRPRDVPNGSMVWRRPTYAEFLNWKKWWAERGEPKGTAQRVQYRRPAHDIPLCECGHGEDSHHTSYLTAFPCRMSCRCLRFQPIERDD